MTGMTHAHIDPADQALHVVFSSEAVKNNFLSEKEGRPIFDTKDVVTITIPGGKSVVTKEVTEELKNRFPRQWDAYQRAHSASTMDGTPISELRAIDKGTEATYKALNIFTLEQLANVPDSTLQVMGMGARENRAKAKAYLDAAKDQSATTSLAAENERLKADYELVKQQIRELQTRILETPPIAAAGFTPMDVAGVDPEKPLSPEDVKKYFGE